MAENASDSSTAVAKWATATSTRESDGWVIVHRLALELRPHFDRASQPVRVELDWSYFGIKGMPAKSEQTLMDQAEDRIEAALGQDGEFATLVHVTTGNNLRTWTFYAASEAEFNARAGEILRNAKPPITVSFAADPNWTGYTDMIAGLVIPPDPSRD